MFANVLATCLRRKITHKGRMLGVKSKNKSVNRTKQTKNVPKAPAW